MVTPAILGVLKRVRFLFHLDFRRFETFIIAFEVALCNLSIQGDPSGNYGGWKATCIGNNAQSALSMLEQDYKEEFNVEEALNLAMTILSKTLDTQTLK